MTTTCDRCGEVNPADIHTCTPKAASVPQEFPLRGILASELKCWHRLTEDEQTNLLAFVKNTAQPAPVQEPVEGYPSDWAKVTLMVSPKGEMHAIAGDRETGDGDEPYIGLERIKAASPAAQPAVQEPSEALRLADAIDPFTRKFIDHLTCKVAADELRRLHAENERLRAAQPAAPLTDEQIESLLPDDDTPMSLGEAFVKFARLVEAHHGITEKGHP